MRATLTSKGQVTIPVQVRRRLGLKVGQILEFDATAPFLKAVPIFDEDEMRSVLGTAKGRMGRSTPAWLDESRGLVALPPKSK